MPIQAGTAGPSGDDVTNMLRGLMPAPFVISAALSGRVGTVFS